MIDVVIPAYNAGRFIRETLRSVAAQTVLPRQVIVVDDSSTDDTVAVVKACAIEHRNRIDIRILANAGPRGPSAARNTAIRASSAGSIALLDADDILTPDHHAILLGLMHATSGTVLAFANSTSFDATTTRVANYLEVSGVLARPAREIAANCFTLDDKMFPALLRSGVFGTSACLFRREAAMAAGLFDEAMMHSEDTDFFLRLALKGRFVFSHALVMHKRVHNDNLSHERHKLAFCRGIALSLTKLATEPAMKILAMQREALRLALHEALERYFYHASLAGISAYWEAARLAHRAGKAAIAVNPRHLARLTLHSFG